MELKVYVIFFMVISSGTVAKPPKKSDDLTDGSGDLDYDLHDKLTSNSFTKQKVAGSHDKGTSKNSQATKNGESTSLNKATQLKTGAVIIKSTKSMHGAIKKRIKQTIPTTANIKEIKKTEQITLQPTIAVSSHTSTAEVSVTQIISKIESQDSSVEAVKTTTTGDQLQSSHVQTSLKSNVEKTSTLISPTLSTTAKLTKANPVIKSRDDRRKNLITKNKHKGLKVETGKDGENSKLKENVNHIDNEYTDKTAKKSQVTKVAGKREKGIKKKTNKLEQAHPSSNKGKFGKSGNFLETPSLSQSNKKNEIEGLQVPEEKMPDALDKNDDGDGSNIVVIERKNEDGKYHKGSGSFSIIFMSSIVLVIIAYAVYHNKQKIIACLIEGKETSNNRRPNSKNYSKLQDAMPSLGKIVT